MTVMGLSLQADRRHGAPLLMVRDHDHVTGREGARAFIVLLKCNGEMDGTCYGTANARCLLPQRRLGEKMAKAR